MRDDFSKRMTRRDMRREATKAAVIEAARSVFLERGYDGTTIKLIADKAGVSPGTVLNAAPSKAALLIQILDEEVDAISEAIASLDGALSGSITDKLTTMLQVSLEQQSQNSELFAAAYGHSWIHRDVVYDRINEQINRAWSGVRAVIKDGVQDGTLKSDLDVNLAVRVLQNLYLGIFHRMCQEDLSGGESNQTLRAQLDMMLTGWQA